jgi:nicotinate phosphoribosyltransferase
MPWSAIRDGRALLTDLYQLTMAQAYRERGMHHHTATFSLFVRRLPKGRNYLVAAGLEPVLDFLERARFYDDDIDWLRQLGTFSESFLQTLSAFRFEGEVWAVPEGTPVFADEPIVEVTAPIDQAQIVETMIMNQINVHTVLASKAARIVTAAADRSVIDFGARRTQGIDASVAAARAGWIAGIDATSNVLAAKMLDIPVAGTMAHSFVQAHDDEREALRAIAEVFPGTILLVDTYDTLAGVDHAIALAKQMGGRPFRAIRIDSGDLGELATEARHRLDAAGLLDVEIIVSGGLDEHAIDDLVRRQCPIDAFGVGTSLGVATDAPALDSAYKLVEYAGQGRYKLSPGKQTLPGRKQVYRRIVDGEAVEDIIVGRDDIVPGEPLLRLVMRFGQRIEPREPLSKIRDRTLQHRETLPAPLLDLQPTHPPYPIKKGDRFMGHNR